MSVLTLVALSSAPVHAKTLAAEVTAVAVPVEDCDTPYADTDGDGVTPADGDRDCLWDGKKKKFVVRPLGLLTPSELECRRSGQCAPAKGFRHGTTTDDEIHPPSHPLAIWLEELGDGHFVGGSPELPGTLVVHWDPDVLWAALEGGDVEVDVAMVVSEDFDMGGFSIQLDVSEELGSFLIVSDAEIGVAAAVPFGETGFLEAP